MLEPNVIKDVPKPADVLWTDEQWQAISAKGKNILVAAAAGSGKTAVLVERIIRRILDPEEPVDVDRLLVVTFTNAAAAEMKKRIGEALEKELSKQPHSLYLKRQLSLLNQASISTLHSFCLDVLRAYYFQLDLDPKFRIAEDTEIALLKEEVIEELFEARYSQAEDHAFFRLVDSFSSDRSDEGLQTLVLQLYEFSRSHPFPQEWLIEMVQFMEEAKLQSMLESLLLLIKKELQSQVEQLQQALKLAQQPAGPAPYALNLAEDIAMLGQVLAACDDSWEQTYEAFQQGSFGRLKSCKGEEIDPQLQERVKELRDQVKKEFAQLKEEYFHRRLEDYVEDLGKIAPLMSTLVELVLEFTELFTQAKRKKAILDFSDLEHGCLSILREPASTMEHPIPSAVAERYQQKFVEILVDEYQDTNLVQESILQSISRKEEGRGNLFMVGDVKQSIYRFRMAEPALFLQKYKAFQSLTSKSTSPSEAENTEVKETRTPHSGWRIDLARNFRSRQQVLQGTNFLFKQVMDEQVGEIEYDDAAELKLGASYPDDPMPIELTIINRDPSALPEELREEWDKGGADSEEEAPEEDALHQSSALVDEAELETVQLEARYMAKRIKELVGARAEESFQVYDPKIKLYRPVRYQDIVILLRASTVWAPAILEEFKQEGIPAYAELSTGYFEATEVAVLLSLLKIIDNPFQDIPLASVLRSPIVGLQGEELALIRVGLKKGSFYEALLSFVEQEPEPEHHSELRHKLQVFLKQLHSWRDRARKGSLVELIWQLYRETGYYDYVGGTPGGNQRQANLRALYDRAKQYEATAFRGLFRFLRFIERMQHRGSDLGTARALTEQEDVVRIMTIHKSKGLEFPVVFVAGLGKMFNQAELREKLLFHKELGIGSRVIDVEQRISYPSLLYQLMKYKLHQEMLAEEMRVLYVALTRAKEKLILVGTLRDAQKKIEQWTQVRTVPDWVLPDSVRAKAKSYLDWIGPALIRHRHAEPWIAYKAMGQEGHSLEASLEALDQPEDQYYGDPSSWHVQIVSALALVQQGEAKRQGSDERWQAIAEKRPIELSAEISKAKEVDERLAWSYAYPMSVAKLAKQSVTELKRQYQWLLGGEDEASLYFDSLESQIRSQRGKPSEIQSLARGRTQSFKPERPRFMQTEVRTLSAAERGTAMHTVLQHLPLGRSLSSEQVTQFLEQMVKQEMLSKEEAEGIHIDQLIRFSNSVINSWFAEAEEIHREVPFTFSLSAQEIFADWDQELDDRVILQGVIDVLCKHQGKWIMIDYKTDAIEKRFNGGFEEAQPVLLERYKVQIDLYTRAIEEIWKVSVDRKMLYLLDGGYTLEL